MAPHILTSPPPAINNEWSVIYHKGTSNEAEYLSRHPVVTQNKNLTSRLAEEYVNYVTNSSVPKSMMLDEIKKSTHNDPILTKVKNSLEEGKWDENVQSIKPFRLSADELTDVHAHARLPIYYIIMLRLATLSEIFNQL